MRQLQNNILFQGRYMRVILVMVAMCCCSVLIYGQKPLKRPPKPKPQPVKVEQPTKPSRQTTTASKPQKKQEPKPTVIRDTVYVPAPVKEESKPIATRGTINGHEWVDLGLSVKWATCNVGASSPSDYGNYYAWGETTTKSEYTEENCKTYERNISDIAGNSNYDAARANWGSPWRIPTRNEMQELIDKCTWTWTTQGGHNGYKVTSKTNGNSIFLPAAGWRDGVSLSVSGEFILCWCATPYGSDAEYAYIFFSVSGTYIVQRFSRYGGLTVRPVCD